MREERTGTGLTKIEAYPTGKKKEINRM